MATSYADWVKKRQEKEKAAAKTTNTSTSTTSKNISNTSASTSSKNVSNTSSTKTESQKPSYADWVAQRTGKITGSSSTTSIDSQRYYSNPEEYARKWGGYSTASDYEKYSAVGSKLHYTDFGSTKVHGGSARKRAYRTIDDYRAAAIALYEHNGGKAESKDTAKYSDQINVYRNMEDDEFQTLSYLIAKDKAEGTNLAKQYVDYMSDTLKNRRGKEIATNLDSINIPVVEYAAKLGHGAMAGAMDAYSGISQYITGENLPTSEYEYANQYISESLSGLAGYGHQAATTIGNMLPSITVGSALGPAAGAAYMGLSVAGNAYAQALDWGYNKKQAMTYGTIVGALEGGLSYAIGGLTKLSGLKLDANIVSKIAAIDNMALRIIAKIGWADLKEIGEEELQNYLEPLVRTVVLGEEYDAPTAAELLETAIVTFLSTGAMEGPGVIVEDISNSIANKREYGGVQNDLVTEAAELNNPLAQQYQERLDNGKNLTGHQLAQLVESNDTAKIQQAAAARMTELGATENVDAIAAIIAKQAVGEELSKAEQDTLRRNRYAPQVVEELNAKNIREGKSTAEWAQKIGTRRINAAEYSRLVEAAQIAPETAETATDTATPATANIAQESAQAAETAIVEAPDAEGPTLLNTGDTAENVELDETSPVSSVNNGRMVLRLADGRNVSADSITTHSTAGVGHVYSTVQKIAPDAKTANTIVNGFKDSGMSASTYTRALELFHMYGRKGYDVADLLKSGNTAKLSAEVRNAAYKAGKIAAGREVAKAQAAVNKGKSVAKGPGKGGRVMFAEGKEIKGGIREYLKSTGIKLNARQEAGVLAMEKMAAALGTDYYVFESYLKNGKLMYVDPETGVEKESAPNGMFSSDGKIYIDLHAGKNANGIMLYTFAHELTHYIAKWSPAKFKVLANFVVKQYGKRGQSVDELVAAQMKKNPSLSYDEAFEEVVADSMEGILADGNVMQMVAEIRKQDMSLADKIVEWFKNLGKELKKIVAAYAGYSPDSHEGQMVAEMQDVIGQIEKLYAEALVDAAESESSLMTMEENTDVVPVESVTKHSYRSLAEAAGFEAVINEDGTRSFVRNGVKVSEVTVEDIENSPIGAFINYSLDQKDITLEDANKQKEMFAKICTMACQTNDFSMTMQFVGSAVFTGMKANADKQYGTTYDFPSICTKTQAVIDAMSKRMVTLGRGLSSDELVKLYQDVFASGNPVPCPECYVFSRWIGIGGLLDNIKKYQDYYGKMSVEEVAKDYRVMRDKVAAFAEEQGISFGKAKGALTSKLTKEYNKLTEKIEKQQNQGEKVKPADQKRLEELEPMMNTVKGMTWLESVYFADSSMKKVNPRFRVPNEVLFDLNNGEAFATQYKEAWAFRTTQGAGYGKAITPYAEASLGEGILVTNNTSKTIKDKAKGELDNYFLKQKGKLDKKAKEALDRARKKQKNQAFIGGQRFQSTSDARYENASDYLLAALEMQAMHGMVQVYTKVDGAVPALAAWNYSINQSLMPLGGGLDANGNVRDTSVGGMNRDIAVKNRKNHETAGTITIGVNDNHIRKMFTQVIRDFIIPYHASGGKADVVAAFRSIQEGQEKKGQMVRSTDYSRTQSDKVLSDEVLRWQGKTEDEISQIHAVRAARIAILTGGSPNMSVVRGNRFLSDLYDKLNGGEWDGVKLAKSKIESQIYPNEFWDQSVSYEDSAKVTEDYLEYCDDLGFLHRFSGTVPSNGMLVPVNGYDQNGNRVKLTDLAYKYDENGQKTAEVEQFFWKVLTDRRMYDNEGSYLPQKIVNLNSTTEKTVTTFAKGNYGRQYDKLLSMETAEKIAGAKYSLRGVEKSFGIKSINDYIGVQKAVISTLTAEGFFDNGANIVTNQHSGMIVEITKDGTRETFGPGMRFEKLPSDLKRLKLATVRSLPEIIKTADVVELNAINHHSKRSSVGYAYLESTVSVDGKEYNVTVTVRRSPQKNKFWIHEIRAEKKEQGLSSSEDISRQQEYNKTLVPAERVPQTDSNVKYSTRDYVAYDSTAILKESKVDEYLEEYAAKSSPKYAQAYIAYVRPDTFLKLTTDDWIERAHIAEDAGELDEEKLSKSRPGIYLRIDHETGEVVGHEGRHRISAMQKAGILNVPVLLLDSSNKMTKTDVEEFTLRGQFDRYAVGTVFDAIPLNYENRDRVIEKFATQSSTQRVGERLGIRNTLKFSTRDTDSMTALEMEQAINDLRTEIATVNDDLMFADDDEYRSLSNKLVKLNHELDKLLDEENRATVKTSMQEILDNLSSYRRSDLESLAEQISDSAWDDYEELSREELEEALREVIQEREYSPLEMQSRRHGLWVRPVEKTEVSKFSLRESVEETKDLVAVHNLREDSLLEALEMGGLPMISIAVMKKDQEFSDYGDISIVFRKDTIDPEADPRNRVFGGDGFTPTKGMLDPELTKGNHSAEEIVEALKQLGDRGVGLGEDVTALAAVAPTEYKSISEIRADKDRLGWHEDENAALETMAASMMQAEELMQELTGGDEATLTNAAYPAMIAAAKQGGSIKTIKSVFKSHGLDLSQQQAEDLHRVYSEIGNMRTMYFEAKPERVIAPNEWALVAVPRDLHPDVREKLEALGANIVEYERGNAASRREAINSNPAVRFSLRESNAALAERDDTALYIKNTSKANYIDMIFSGAKTEETRTRRTLDAFVGKDFFVTDGKYVYGSIVMGEPHKYTSEEFHDKKNQLKHRVPVGDEYDIKPGGIKWAYPIESYKKFDEPKKLSESTEYKNSFQARQVLYSLRDGESVSNRSLLANAFEGVAQNDIEKDKIQEYKSKIDTLNAEEQKLQKLNAEIKQLSFAQGARDTERIAKLREEAQKTANRINTYDGQLLRLEASKPLQSVLERERAKAYKRAEKRGKEALEALRKEQREKTDQKLRDLSQRYQEQRRTAVAKVRETAEKNDAREKLQKLVLDTAKWISYPAKDDVKCPDVLKAPYAEFLKSIDLSSKRLAAGGDPTKNDLKLTSAMDSLATALDRLMATQDPSQSGEAVVLDAGYLDLPAGFVQRLRDMTENFKRIMKSSDGYVVNNMTAAEVRQVSQLIRTLNHAIKEMSTLYANQRFASVEELGYNSMEYMDGLGEVKSTSDFKNFVTWDNALPYYAFKRFGEAGRSVFEGLMDAQDKLAFLADEIFKFRDRTWKASEAKKWSEDVHTVELPSGGKLKMTTADAMSIYCLSRRPQGRQHLLGGGVRVVGFQKGSKKAQDTRSTLTMEDLAKIISTLTDRQRAVAEAMQEFMSTTCSEWGNEISMKRFLTKEFNEKYYFPIESNDENMPTKDPSAQQSDLFRLLNISATKPIDPRANNELIVRNIFEVFTDHTADMARLNAFGMPLLDYMKWLNYREKTTNDDGQINVRGVRKSMEKAYGNAAKSYVMNLIKDVNGRPSDGGDPTWLMKWMRAAKTASVGSSLRVATLQVTSYPRASLVLSQKSLALGLTKKPNINKAKKYCGIALWKSFGFYDTNIARSMEDQIKGNVDLKQKLIELSLKGAELGDAMTWGALWNACEYEVAATKQYKVGTEEFNKAVGLKLREVVYRTQVVDSTLTRSQIMRSKKGMAQEAAAFMSEPTLSGNILMDAGFEYTAEKRRTGSATKAWKKTGKIVGSAVAVYGISALTSALLESLWDAWRDDEDEEYVDKFLKALPENVIMNIAPFNKIPVVSDIFSAAMFVLGVGYYSSDKMSTTWITQAVDAVSAWKKALDENSSTTIYDALYKTVRAGSSYVGIAFSGAMREVVDLWNNTAGAYDSTLKIRKYEPTKDQLGKELYNAITSGDTRQAESLRNKIREKTADEDEYKSYISSAMRKALRENDSRIWEAAVAWNNNDLNTYMNLARGIVGEGNFTQDDVVAAIRAEANSMIEDDGGTTESKAKSYFTTEKFAAAVSQGNSSMADIIREDIILTHQKNGKSAADAEKSFNSSAKGELRELFETDKLSESEAVNALVNYTGMSREEATEDVDEWGFKLEYGYTYSDRETAYKNGDISAYELREVLIEIGGKTPEEADLQIQVYDWEKEVPGVVDITAAAIKDYNENCAAYGISKSAYYDAWTAYKDIDADVDQYGKTIKNSKVQKVMPYIDSLPLTAEQKTALAKCWWAESTVRKYKLW